LTQSRGPEQELIPLEVKKGSLILLHGLLPHRSLENRSQRSRHAYTLHVIAGTARYPADNWLQRSNPNAGILVAQTSVCVLQAEQPLGTFRRRFLVKKRTQTEVCVTQLLGLSSPRKMPWTRTWLAGTVSGWSWSLRAAAHIDAASIQSFQRRLILFNQ
jgi:hypothetical protein